LIAAADTGLRGGLRPGPIHAESAADDAPMVLDELAAMLSQSAPGVGSEPVRHALEVRERLGSTAIGDGCAIPHIRLARVRETILVLLRTARGVEFGAADGRPVRLFFGLAVPAGATGAHLQALSAIARWLKLPGHREALLAAPDAEAMRDLLVGGGPA
jgi:PTS system nitrogen regulatory IIA component